MKTKYFSIFMDGNAVCFFVGHPEFHDLMERKAYFVTIPFYKVGK